MSNHSLPANFPSFNYLDDPNPPDAPKGENPHKYRSTKAFFSRNCIQTKSCKTWKSLQTIVIRNNKSIPRIWQDNYILKKNEILPITTKQRYDHRSQFLQEKRIISPWCEDDPESLKILRKRIKSAPVVLNCPASQHKPRCRLSHSNTALTILKEFDQERSTVTSRNGKRFKTTPMTDRYIAAYMHHQETANRAKGDQHVLNDHNAPPNRPKVLPDNDHTGRRWHGHIIKTCSHRCQITLHYFWEMFWSSRNTSSTCSNKKPWEGGFSRSN